MDSGTSTAPHPAGPQAAARSVPRAPLSDVAGGLHLTPPAGLRWPAKAGQHQPGIVEGAQVPMIPGPSVGREHRGGF